MAQRREISRCIKLCQGETKSLLLIDLGESVGLDVSECFGLSLSLNLRIVPYNDDPNDKDTEDSGNNAYSINGRGFSAL